MIITVDKSAIAHNEKHSCWQGPNRRNPIRVSHSATDPFPASANLVEIRDKDGNPVAVVAASKDGKPIEGHGTTVVIFTQYPAKVKA